MLEGGVSLNRTGIVLRTIASIYVILCIYNHDRERERSLIMRSGHVTGFEFEFLSNTN